MSALLRFLLGHAFVRFAVVGGAGYVVNAAVLAVATYGLHMAFAPAIAISIFVSMCFTWLGNRYLTFRDARAHGGAAVLREWLKFMGANLVGAAVNYGVALAVVHFAPAPFDNRFVAQGIGVLAGLAFNFTLSRKIVFRDGA